MDQKLEKILRLALHPGTGAGEAQAALNRARVMVDGQDLDKILGSATKSPQPKTEYRDRVIYRDFHHTHRQRSTYKIADRWHHSFIERLFGDASNSGCRVEMVSCTTEEKSMDSRTVLTVDILGTEYSLYRFDRVIDGWFTEMNSKKTHTAAPNPEPTVKPETVTPKPKPRTWTQRVVDLFA